MTSTVGKIIAALALIVVGFWAFGLVLGAVSGLVRLAIFIFTAIAFIDAVVTQDSIAAKAIWGGIILVVPVLGAVAYFLVGRDSKTVTA